MNLSVWKSRLEQSVGKLEHSLNGLGAAKLYTALAAGILLLRLLSLNVVEKSGDAVYKWGIIRRFVETGVWYPALPDHHQARWAIMMPELLFAKIFGTEQIWAYYAFPVLCGVLASLLIFRIVEKLHSRLAALCACLILFFLPQVNNESVQFLPMVPATTFMLLALLMMIDYLETLKLRYLVFCALATLASHGCKITSLYWAAAFGLFLLFFDPATTPWRLWKFRITKGVLLFSLLIAGGLAVETLILNHVFEVKAGQISIIMGAHIKDNQQRLAGQYKTTLEYLFSVIRPLDFSGKFLEAFPKNIVTAGAFLALWLGFAGRDLRVKMLCFCFCVAYFFHSYMVYKVFPFVHPEKSFGRYYIVLYAVSVALCCIEWPQIKSFLAQKLSAKFARLLCLAVVGVLAVSLAANFINTLKRDGNLRQIIGNELAMKEVHAGRLPVLVKFRQELKSDGDVSSKYAKRFNLWATLYGPADRICYLDNIKPEAVTANGESYWVVFYPESIRYGEENRVWVGEEIDGKFMTLLISK